MSEQVSGFLNVNKPAGITSHDVVARVRRLAHRTAATKKVGHAGTLDPLATGVLILCLGHATRLSEYAMQSQKQYRATIQLGVTTDTYDAEGEITATHDTSHITREEVQKVLQTFQGDIQQVPPMFSAIKKDGKKLYELARAGKSIEVEARPVSIFALELLEWNNPFFVLNVNCSPGTYIRSLVHDIGQALGVGAHLTALERTRSGNFRIENAVTLDTLLHSEHWRQYLITPADGLADWQALTLSDEQAREIEQGRSIENNDRRTEEQIMAYCSDGYLLAVLENRGQYWKPHKVFLPHTLQE